MNVRFLTGDHKACASEVRNLLFRIRGKLLVWATEEGWACVPDGSEIADRVRRTFAPDIAGVFVRGVGIEALREALLAARESMILNGRMRTLRSYRTREYNTVYMRAYRARKRAA